MRRGTPRVRDFGLHLTPGAFILVAGGWLFGGIAEDVVSGDPLTVIDARVAAWFHHHAVPITTGLMLVITHLHDLRGIRFITLIVVVAGGTLLNLLTKSAFRRERPSFSSHSSVWTATAFRVAMWPLPRWFMGIGGADPESGPTEEPPTLRKPTHVIGH